MALEIQSLLNNRYRITGILGQGGMASVYRAIDENLGLEVAVKENLFPTEEYERQFRLEATILASLRHANLPRVTDHFSLEGKGQYLVMDYIEGEDLRQRMDRLGVLQETDVILIGLAICEALIYLHSLTPSVLHRDVKPGNVKIDPNGNIFLVDFGLAKVVQDGEMTTTGARAMTPGYSPPEQYGTARTDQRSDIYSLGATLYSALTDALPEDGLARAMEQVELTPLRDHNPNVSRRLAGIIEKSLEVRPDDRYQSAEAMRTNLLNALSASQRKEPVDLVLEPPPPSTYEASGGEHGQDNVGEKGEPISDRVQKEKSDRPILPASYGSSSPGTKGRRTRRQRAARRKVWAGIGTLGLVFLLFGLSWFNANTSFSTTSTPPITTPTVPADSPSGWALPSRNTSAPTQTPPAVLPLTQTAEPATPTSSGLRPTSTSRITPLPSRSPTTAPQPTPIGGGQPQIAFASDRSGVPEIYLINLDGTGLKKVTDIAEGACQPSWSPDGSRMVFISPCSRVSDTYPGSSLFIVNADGSELTPLPTLPGGDFEPFWSPDGNRILFTSLRGNAIPQLFVIDLRTGLVASLSEPEERNYQGSWSPDGSKIAYVGPRNQIWLMNADGTDRVLISRPSNFINRHPRWAPDGQSLVFSQYEEGTSSWLATVQTDPGAITMILAQDNPMSKPSFSPDGFWLVYQGRVEGSSRELFIMTRNGVNRQRLTTDTWNDFDPVWRPGPEVPDGMVFSEGER
jgi:eukaryotic-like serine/threonine-protein kinase